MRKIMAHSNAASNVALKGVTSQSSTYGAGDPKKAADGSLKNKDPETQCAKTKENLDSWWTLDLQSDHKVSSIAITSRADCCEEDLEGAEIHIGNSATGWKKNPICGTVFSIGLGETFSFHCDGMQGRFVTIVIPDKNRSLTLCEVQVFAVPIENPTGEEWDGDFEMQKQHHGDDGTV
ncbi:Hypothetical predicted protein [Pelobates cultripes]|uniref:Fucolectin tachylectin-4 pentraxin-1 domain-containing protein n=1 Tax=Pelobates cultripes TaxID=61616 RepID=A0AAD1T147_PELCU|nr:Hypothetical predicted protein [Pelobates cultripes]